MQNPIILSPEDKLRLQGIANDKNSVLSKRAKIILACAEGKNNSEIAKTLEIDRSTVAKWRKLFLDKGITSLDFVYTGGKPKCDKLQEIDKIVSDIISKYSVTPTISVIANESGFSYRQVQQSLKRQNILLRVKRKWEIHTVADPDFGKCSVIGVFLSKDLSAILVAEFDWGMSFFPGCFSTLNRKIWQDAERFTDNATLENLLSAAAIRAGIQKQNRGEDLSIIIQDILYALPAFSGLKYHIFSLCDCFPCYSGIRPNEIKMEFFKEHESWQQAMHSLIAINSKAIELFRFEHLQKCITKYLLKNTNLTEYFIWNRQITNLGSKNFPIIRDDNFKEENNGLLDIVRDILDERLLPVSDNDFLALFIPIVLDNRNGSYKIITDDNFISSSSFSFTDLDRFTEGFNSVESEILKLRDDAGRHIIRMLIDEIKKKKQNASKS